MKRFRRLLAVVLIGMILCGCIEQAPPDFSSGTVSAAPVSSSAPEPDNPVPCPDHDPNLEVTNQNAQESALLIAPDGEEGLWIWTPSKTDASLGTLVQTPAAPAVVRFVGADSVQAAVNYTNDMYEITQGKNTQLTMPNLDFQGVPTGIDIRKVVESGITPVINTGMAHKKPGVGQVGAGSVRAPMDCFTQALLAFAEAVGVK